MCTTWPRGVAGLIANFRGSNSAPASAPDGRTLAVTLSRDGSWRLSPLTPMEESHVVLCKVLALTPDRRATVARFTCVSDEWWCSQVLGSIGGGVANPSFFWKLQHFQ